MIRFSPLFFGKVGEGDHAITHISLVQEGYYPCQGDDDDNKIKINFK